MIEDPVQMWWMFVKNMQTDAEKIRCYCRLQMPLARQCWLQSRSVRSRLLSNNNIVFFDFVPSICGFTRLWFLLESTETALTGWLSDASWPAHGVLPSVSSNVDILNLPRVVPSLLSLQVCLHPSLHISPTGH